MPDRGGPPRSAPGHPDLWDASRAQAGILQVDGLVGPLGPRMTAMTMFLAREWGVHDLADALQASAEARYQPTWDKVRGEFTWGFELDEPHTRGQYNGHMAAAEVVTEGAWSRLANVGSEARFGEPTVVGPDLELHLPTAELQLVVSRSA